MYRIQENELKAACRLFKKTVLRGTDGAGLVKADETSEGFWINIKASIDIHSELVELFIDLLNAHYPAIQIARWRLRYEEVKNMPQQELRFFVN